MSTTSPAVAVTMKAPGGSRIALLARVVDYIALAKPRIAVMVLVTVAVSAVLACSGAPERWLLLHALVGTALISASASAGNQWLERRLDARMARTVDRPLATGRLTATEGLIFGLTTGALGLAWLAWFTAPQAAMWGAITWVAYVAIYTPLKTRTPQNTAVGAVAGALPVFIGWSAMGQPLTLPAAMLWLVIYLWQFPHFMAIAWIYRHDYAAAGMPMLPVVDPSGRRAGQHAMLAAATLLPISLLPTILGWAGPIYAIAACLLGAGYAAASLGFALRPGDNRARVLLRVSLAYLPAMLTLFLLVPRI